MKLSVFENKLFIIYILYKHTHTHTHICIHICAQVIFLENIFYIMTILADLKWSVTSLCMWCSWVCVNIGCLSMRRWLDSVTYVVCACVCVCVCACTCACAFIRQVIISTYWDDWGRGSRFTLKVQKKKRIKLMWVRERGTSIVDLFACIFRGVGGQMCRWTTGWQHRHGRVELKKEREREGWGHRQRDLFPQLPVKLPSHTRF